MPARDLPPVVRAFVETHVRTLEELELLMAIVLSEDRWWDARRAAAESGLTTAAARAALDRFAAGNLLDIRITGDLRYQFRPGTPELEDAARATLEAFRARPLDLARLVKPPSRPSVGDFADAFRIRPDDDHDR